MRGQKIEIAEYKQQVLDCGQNIVGFLNFLTFFSVTCSQIWLSPLVDNRQTSQIRKIKTLHKGFLLKKSLLEMHCKYLLHTAIAAAAAQEL
jgi:hypothetical protein